MNQQLRVWVDGKSKGGKKGEGMKKDGRKKESNKREERKIADGRNDGRKREKGIIKVEKTENDGCRHGVEGWVIGRMDG